MNLCSDDHDEVCYEGRDCPACEVKKEAERNVRNLEDQLSALENRIGELEGEIEELKNAGGGA